MIYKVKRFSKSDRQLRRESDNQSFNSSLDDKVSQLNKGEKLGRSMGGAMAGAAIGMTPAIYSPIIGRISNKAIGLTITGASAIGGGLGYMSGRKTSKDNLSKAEIVKNKFKSANKRIREQMHDDLAYHKPNSREFRDNLNKWSKED